MTIDIAVRIVRQALGTVLLVASPVLVTSLIIGLIISIFQTTTSIQEQTLTFVPKLIGIFLSVIIFVPLMAQVLINFARNLFLSFPNIVR